MTGIGLVAVAVILFFLPACSSDANRSSAASTLKQDAADTAIKQETTDTAIKQEGTDTAMQETEPTSSPAASVSTPVVSKELFKYDSKPLNVQELSVKETVTGVKIHEISYDAYDPSKNPEGKVSCYLLEPKGEGPFPAVLYFHWLGTINSNKDEFLDEATALAEKGIAGLLIDGVFPWKVTPSELNKDKSMVVYQVIELQRALDYITSLPNIDAKRTAYVGHDFGALYGAVLSGVDKRISNYVFVAGMGNFSDWFLGYWVFPDEDGRQKYRTDMKELDPVNYIRNAAPAKAFFQFANSDPFIPKKTADEFYEAASQPKEVKFYDAGHRMEIDEVRLDRQKWLMENLK